MTSQDRERTRDPITKPPQSSPKKNELNWKWKEKKCPFFFFFFHLLIYFFIKIIHVANRKFRAHREVLETRKESIYNLSLK